MSERDTPARAVTAAGFAVFLLLGVVIASYGPSIPHIIVRFDVGVSVAGLIVTANFLGEVIGLMALGLTHARWSLGQRLGVGTSVFGVGLLAAAVAPTWPLLLLAVFVLGIGAGGLVVLINLYYATRFGRRSPAMRGLDRSSAHRHAMLPSRDTLCPRRTHAKRAGRTMRVIGNSCFETSPSALKGAEGPASHLARSHGAFHGSALVRAVRNSPASAS